MQENISGNDRLSLARCLRGLLRLRLVQTLTPFVFPVALLIDGDNHAGMLSELSNRSVKPLTSA